jgi:diaminopimelate epimerase
MRGGGAPRPQMINFAKAHAYGNDFLYVPRSEIGGIAEAAFACEVCDRHAGVGADGLIVYQPTPSGASMTLWNADGSRAEVSGNGVRALAALLLRRDDSSNACVAIETDAGVRRLTRLERNGVRQTFRSSMGLPSEPVQISIAAGAESVQAVSLQIGNPQCVILGALPDVDRFRRLGEALERHPMFPDGTNVEFAEVESPTRVRILIWERGVGPTQSSGTGSCAALVAAAAFGGATHEAEVVAPGGAQRVEWRADSIYLTGWAEVLCEGTWLPQFPRTTI